MLILLGFRRFLGVNPRLDHRPAKRATGDDLSPARLIVKPTCFPGPPGAPTGRPSPSMDDRPSPALWIAGVFARSRWKSTLHSVTSRRSSNMAFVLIVAGTALA